MMASCISSAETAAASPSSTTENMDQLRAMGYDEDQCAKALRIAHGDLDQAINWLLMGKNSQRAFDYSFHESICEDDSIPRDGTSNSPVAIDASGNADLFDTDDVGVGITALETSDTQAAASSPEDQLVMLGYSHNQAINALRIAEGDLDQALNFLAMGRSRQGFLLDIEHFSSERSLRCCSNNENEDPPGGIPAAVVDPPFVGPPPISDSVPSPRNNNPLPSTGPKPKIVSTRGFLSLPDATPFCACYAASRFLKGGVVSAPFLNEIMEAGIELYRKKNTFDMNIDTIIKMYGRSHLGIQAIQNGEEDPKRGIFIDNDLQNEKGIRKLMATCRNQQEAGWQIILVELKNDFFCICLPPKGSANKFWFLDFCSRVVVRTPGAYALVHNSLLQLEETMEAIFKSIGQNNEVDYIPFTLYRVKKKSR
jgi:hypothetical protein